jgi:hypothetical protein
VTGKLHEGTSAVDRLSRAISINHSSTRSTVLLKRPRDGINDFSPHPYLLQHGQSRNDVVHLILSANG